MSDDTPDPKSWGQPAFARDFPAHPELDRLVAAFAAGDYRTVRDGTPGILASDADEAVKAGARLLRERTQPDPTSRLLFLFAAALLVFLTGWWIAHDGPKDGETTKHPRPPASSAPSK